MGSSRTTQTSNSNSNVATNNTTSGSATTSRDPYGAARGGIDAGLSGLTGWMNDPRSRETYSGPRVAGMNPLTRSGIAEYASAGGARQARDYLSNVVGGSFLNNNPYQSALDQSIIEATMPSLNAQFSQAGMSGSTLHQGQATRALTSALAAPRYQNYQNERGFQQNAAMALPGVDERIGQREIEAGQVAEGYDQRRYDADRQAFDERRMAGMQPYAAALPFLLEAGNAFGSGTSTETGTQSGTQVGQESSTTTQRQRTPLGQQIMGGLMMGGSLFSGLPMMGMGTSPVMRPDWRMSTPGMGSYAPDLPWRPRGA